nr:uncharacterized protein C8orf46 homolog [Loxodonta africana]
MHQIYSCSDENIEVFTTVIPSKASSPARRRVKSSQHLLAKNVVIESDLYAPRPLELLPHRSDRLQGRDGEARRFGRLQNARQQGPHAAKTPARPMGLSDPKSSSLCGSRAYGKSLVSKSCTWLCSKLLTVPVSTMSVLTNCPLFQKFSSQTNRRRYYPMDISSKGERTRFQLRSLPGGNAFLIPKYSYRSQEILRSDVVNLVSLVGNKKIPGDRPLKVLSVEMESRVIQAVFQSKDLQEVTTNWIQEQEVRGRQRSQKCEFSGPTSDPQNQELGWKPTNLLLEALQGVCGPLRFPRSQISVKAPAAVEAGSTGSEKSAVMPKGSRHLKKMAEEYPALPQGAEASLPLTGSASCGVPSILRKMWMKHKKKSEYVGATNSAFEAD